MFQGFGLLALNHHLHKPDLRTASYIQKIRHELNQTFCSYLCIETTFYLEFIVFYTIKGQRMTDTNLSSSTTSHQFTGQVAFHCLGQWYLKRGALESLRKLEGR